GLDRRACRDPSHHRDRYDATVVAAAGTALRQRRYPAEIAVDDARLEAGLAPPERGVHRVRQLDHLERPRPIWQPADETPLLERRDQPVDAGFRPQVERILHLVKGRRYTRLLHPLVDEHEQ